MKKLVSVLLTIAMLLGAFAMTSVAASDTCIRLVDTNGSSAYSAGSSAVNNYVIENSGATLIFDVKIESNTTPTAGLFSQILAFSGDEPYNNAAYNFGEKKFTISDGTQWPTSDQTNANYRLAARDFELYKGLWYELAFQFNGNEVVIYVDGTPMAAAELDSVKHEYLLLYPQLCTLLIDNLRVCDKNYNVRDKVGTVKYATDFSGITSVTGCSAVWDFSGAGYSVSQSGRPMPEIGEIVPNRAVDPKISGSYLRYKQNGSYSSVASSPINFSAYNGFTVVEDIRVDNAQAGASFGVRFGSNFVAGYDWDSQTFRIAQRAGYGFSTATGYSYGEVSYPLTLKTTYEFAVRQNGNSVTVYLNGVVVLQASNDAFVAGFNDIQLNHYRVNAAIDNLVVAYSDYDVKEAFGGTVAKLTFDESASYINNNVWDFNIGETSSGYSIDKSGATAKVTVDSVKAVDGVATVGVSLSGLSAYNSFVVTVDYPAELKISKATLATISGAQTAMSSTTSNPLVISCVMNNSTTADTDIVEINFKTPTYAGEYTITATVTPSLDGVEGASVTGTGKITVPKPEVVIQKGIPSGVDYDGEMLTWDADDAAVYYGIYVIYTDDGYEEFIDETEDPEYELVFTDWFGDPAVYHFRIYAYDENYNVYGVSEDFIVIFDEDENLIFGVDLASQAKELYAQLEALVADRIYNEDNQALVDECLDMASIEFSEAADYSELLELYDRYYEELDAIPESELVLGMPDGISYNGQSLTWNYFNGADHYKVYVNMNGGDSELLATVDFCKYDFVFTDEFTDAGEYGFTVLACNAKGNVLAQSDEYVIILDGNGTVHSGLASYAKSLCDNLDRLVSDKLYSVADQENVNATLETAKAGITAAATYTEMTSLYNNSYAALDAIPVMEIIDGEPAKIAYANDTLTWTDVSDAARYEIYIVAEDGSENYVGESSEVSFVLPYEENFGAAGEYGVKIYVYNKFEKLFAVSEVLTLVFDADGNVYYSLIEYADTLYAQLEALVADRKYTAEDKATVDALLDEARQAFLEADTYVLVNDLYTSYYTTLDAIPEGSDETFVLGDANGDGTSDMSDITYLVRWLAGASLEVYPGADMDGNGEVNITDLTALRRSNA